MHRPVYPWRRELGATLALAVPIALTQVAQIAIVTTDVVMLGWLSPEALAASALGANLYWPLWMFALGLVLAIQPMIAQAAGRRRRMLRDIRRSVRQGCWVALAVGVPAMALLWQVEPALRLLGQDEGLAADAGAYVRALLWGFVPALWFVALRSFVSALQRPRSALAVTAVAVLVNAALVYALTFGALGLPRLELVGAGLASALTNALMFALQLGFVLRDRRFRRYALLGRFWRPDWRRFAEIVRVGAPIGAGLVLEVGMFSAAALMMGRIGAAALAAHAIALQCAAIAFMLPMGIGQAATIRVGQWAGAGDMGGVRRAGWTALALGLGLSAGNALVLWLGARTIAAWFVDAAEPGAAAVVEIAVGLFAVAALFQFVDGTQTIAAGALRGLKDTRVPMLIAGAGYWLVGVSASALFGFALGGGGVGVWLGLALGLAVAAALLTLRFARRSL